MVNTLALSRLLIKEAPDFIISTHFLATDVAANLKVIGKLKSKIINVITDFGVHSFWIAKGVDRYIVASGFTKEQLVLRGVPENKISDFGIPTSDKFMRNYDKEGILKGLGLQDKFTVLVMSGSFGIGPIEKIVRLLQGQLQMIVVCGRNRSLCRKLEKLRLSGVKVFGLVKSVADLMAASDLVITKPGGLSIAEILNMELVPVFISPIPGQEAANIEVLKSYGIGFYPARIDEVKEIVLWLAKNPGELEPIKNNILRIKKPDALKEITSVIR
jgi:processive 1,2-diacylglycerol beta-glucosyltransferase